jgi:tetratricopeptide (TPR) repeat protein
VISHGEPRPCPSPEVLHRFIEGILKRTTARDVALHIETCRDCRFIVRETMEFLHDDRELLTEDSSEPSSFGRGWWLVPAAAAIIGLAFLWFYPPADEGRRFDRALAAAPVRPVEGRLSGVLYAQYRVNMGPEDRRVPAQLESLARGLLSESPEDAREWHRHGMASLLAGDSQAAIAAFERAARLDAHNALYRSDLAAARLARGVKLDDPKMLAAASGDAQQALDLVPGLPEAHFNLALAFERRHLFKEAYLTYRRYQMLDRSSPWADEARARSERLRALTGS